MNRPVAVLISDTHYTPATLELARASTKMALAKAEELKVPLIDAGDLLDSKAIIRAECANALIDIFKAAKTKVILLVGNHTLVNTKGTEHSLNFLRPYCTIVDGPSYDPELDMYFMPYYEDNTELQLFLKTVAPGSIIIAHQGVQTAYMGHYTQDKSSLPKEAFGNFRVISGHYHRRQTIKCAPTGYYPDHPERLVGEFSYLGNPYTLNFGEASDGPKGFSILMDDGTLEFIPTGLRKHVVYDCKIEDLSQLIFVWENLHPNKGDLVWLKVRGPYSELQQLNKKEIGEKLVGHSNYKLDLIPTDKDIPNLDTKVLTGEEMFDKIIDSTTESGTFKDRLKNLWRKLLCVS